MNDLYLLLISWLLYLVSPELCISVFGHPIRTFVRFDMTIEIALLAL